MIDLCLRAGLILRVVTPHHEYRRSLTELVRSVSCRPTRLRSKPAPRRGSSLSTTTKRTSGKRRKSNSRRKPSRATGQARGSQGKLGQEQPARLTPKCPFFFTFKVRWITIIPEPSSQSGLREDGGARDRNRCWKSGMFLRGRRRFQRL